MDVCHAQDVVHPALDVAHDVVDVADILGRYQTRIRLSRSSHLLLPRDNVRLLKNEEFLVTTCCPLCARICDPVFLVTV